MSGAAMTFHLPTTDTPRAGHWIGYGPPAPSMRYDSYPGFSFIPVDGGPEPTRHGDFIIDLDAGDVMEAVREARKVVEYFETVYGIPPEQWRLYLSGSKGVHLVLPAEVLGMERGHKLLPAVCKRLALDLAGNAELKTLDLSLYCMGTGRPFRLANRQRENGLFKVPLTFDELCEIGDAEDYKAICSTPWPEPPRAAVERNDRLAEKIIFFTAEAEDAAREKPAPLDDAMAERLKKDAPACITAISRATTLPKSAKTFNEVSMQLIGYAVTAGLTEAQTVELFHNTIKNYPSPSNTPYPVRLDDFKTKYRHMAAHAKGFSCAAVLALGFAGFDCGACMVKKSEKGEVQTSAGLDKFVLNGGSEAMEKKLLTDVHYLGRMALLGQSSVWYAKPNDAKTLLTIWLLIRGIESGRISGANVYYINADDNFKGLTAKLKLAERYGFKMLAPSHNGFKAEMLTTALAEMVQSGTAKEKIVILDTLKKFTDIMDKRTGTKFGEAIRQFVSHGGTVHMLAHVNKHKDTEGKVVYSGTSDIVDDADCVYTLTGVVTNPFFKTVKFENIKDRGDIVKEATFRFSTKAGQSYSALLNSVEELAPEEATEATRAAAREELASDNHAMITAILNCTREGFTKKTELIAEVRERTGESRKKVLQVLAQHEGTNLLRHEYWTTEKGDKNQTIYILGGTP